MDFISNKEPQIKAMLAELGLKEVDELFVDVPAELKLKRPSTDDGLSEYEGLQLMESLAAKNTFPSFANYLGAGAYEHHVPAIVGAICSKSEFLTSYTPYQAEASQGMLQAIFEFQSAICALTEMDGANASVYDGASACAEAVLMALRVQKTRQKILIAESLNPRYRAVVEQYLRNHDVEIVFLSFNDQGQTELPLDLNEESAALLLQSPNFFGTIEKTLELFQRAKEKGIVTILCSDPLAYGLFPSAVELGADIAVGDCQPFGIPLQFGGPYAGYMACRQEIIRQLPGRIVCETVDTEGRRGFVLTLQAREQHIRREKATSNICTNQALAALASLIAILWYGPKGVKELALTNYQRTAYLRSELGKIPGIQLMPQSVGFNEFVWRCHQPFEKVAAHFRQHGIEPGVDLGRYYPQLKGYLLTAVTETKSLVQLNTFFQMVMNLASQKQVK